MCKSVITQILLFCGKSKCFFYDGWSMVVQCNVQNIYEHNSSVSQTSTSIS